jgi:tetratricopeptide (TPR) repeat protein
MGMAKCAHFFDSLAHKEYMTIHADLDDSNSSMYSTFSSVSNLNHTSEDINANSSVDREKGMSATTMSATTMSKCIERLRLSLSLDPEHTNAMFALAILLCSGKHTSSVLRSEEAEQLFKDIIVLDPEYPKCFYNLGHVYFARGQYGDSLTCFDSAIYIDNLDLEARVYKALCLTQLGGVENIGAAMNEYRNILTIDSVHYLALYNLGILLATMEDFSGAIFTFQNIIMSDPENVDALGVLAKSFQMRAERALKDINLIKSSNNSNSNNSSNGNSSSGGGSGSSSIIMGEGGGFVPEHAAVIEDLRRALR